MLNKAKLKRKIDISSAIPLFILFVLMLVLTILDKEFLSSKTMINLMQQVASVGIVAIGAMLCIITGGIDFSSGYGLAMIGMAAATIYSKGPFNANIPVFLLLFILVGALLGCVNGLLTSKLKILPFIATLVTMSFAQGMSLYINGGTMIMLTNSPILVIGQGKIGGIIPVSFLIYLFLCCAAALMLKRTKLGVYIYAIGGNETALRYTGVKVDQYKIFVYVLAGICTGIASMVTVSSIAMATPSIYGTTLTDAIAAACIGGTSMRGGKGTVIGTFVGSIIIVLISTALTYLRIQAEMQSVFKGAVILLAVTIDAIANNTVANNTVSH